MNALTSTANSDRPKWYCYPPDVWRL